MKSLILPYEWEPIDRKEAGRFFLLWRRQGRKTTTLAKKALHFMMKKPGGRLVTFASASLLVGSELIVREGQVIESARERVTRDAQAIRTAFENVRKGMKKKKMKLETNGDDLSPDDFAGLFEQQKLEARVWHSQTVCSRTRIIAPNPATARSWSGCVFVDEAGHIANLADLLEAMEPIMSSDPEFRLLMAGTPPNDEAHLSYELTLPPEGAAFSPDPKGHWYTSQAGLLVHRVDAWDAAAAKLPTYDPDTREKVTPEQHRAKALDRNAWDRNYGLVFKPGGTAALSLALLHHAMTLGRGQCAFAEDDFAPGWRDLLGGGRIAIGFDPATTEKKMSNPSALAVVEQVGTVFYARLVLVFKTSDPAASRAMLREALDLGHDPHGQARRARRVCIDATNERFFASGLKQELAGRAVCELVVSSEKTARGGEEMSFKTWLGSLLVHQMEDGLLALPESRYLKEDFRLVTRDRGGFDNQLDKQGRHGDTFDAVKLALHGLFSHSGPAHAEAVPLSSATGSPPRRTGWKNPFLRQIEGGVKINV
ncbi:MAG: hypothetical protein LV481_07910 [Methylacidiphilales bacterium]|nr:hypothetical protein [Candidatus Methylacidiphilales bacterium]